MHPDERGPPAPARVGGRAVQDDAIARANADEGYGHAGRPRHARNHGQFPRGRQVPGGPRLTCPPRSGRIGRDANRARERDGDRLRAARARPSAPASSSTAAASWRCWPPVARPTRATPSVIDLEGAYLLPGLWDVHIHPDYLASAGASVAEQVAHLRPPADAGADRERHGRRAVRGSRTASWTWRGSAPSRPGSTWARGSSRRGTSSPRPAGTSSPPATRWSATAPTASSSAIREQIKNGVDHIKLNLTGGIMGPAWDRHSQSFLLQDELEAAFAICRQRGFTVMAHAANPEAVQERGAARRAQRRARLHHGRRVPSRACSQHGTWYVPTLAISHLTPDQARRQWESAGWSERNLAAVALLPRGRGGRRASRGVPRRRSPPACKMALGSDIRPLKEAALLEMGLWVRGRRDAVADAAGRHAARRASSAASATSSAPSSPASSRTSSWWPPNPLENITNLRRLLLVLKEGRIVSDKRGPNQHANQYGGLAE